MFKASKTISFMEYAGVKQEGARGLHYRLILQSKKDFYLWSLKKRKMKTILIWVWQLIQTVSQQFFPVPLSLRIYGHNQLVRIQNNE